MIAQRDFNLIKKCKLHTVLIEKIGTNSERGKYNKY